MQNFESETKIMMQVPADEDKTVNNDHNGAKSNCHTSKVAGKDKSVWSKVVMLSK